MERLEYYLQEENWITSDHHAFNHNELWFPLANYSNSWDEDFHVLMLKDRTRMSAYKNAIEDLANVLIQQCLKRNSTVRILDLGSGSGVWTYFLNSIWKKKAPSNIKNHLKIYAIETNPNIYNNLLLPNLSQYLTPYKKNKEVCFFDDNIICINCRSNELISYLTDDISHFDMSASSCFDKKIFDGLISECLGAIGDDEGFTEIINDLKTILLKEKAFIIPEYLSQHFVLVKDYKEAISKQLISNKVKTISQNYNPNTRDRYDVIIPSSQHCSDIIEGCFFDYKNNINNSAYSINRKFTISDSKCDLVGIKVFFESILFTSPINGYKHFLKIGGDDIKTKCYVSDCWKHTFLPFKKPIKTLDTNQKLIFSFNRRLLKDKLAYSWSISNKKTQLLDQNKFTSETTN